MQEHLETLALALDQGVRDVELLQREILGRARRLTRAMRARDYEVVSVPAPTDEEKARHYLWRFWRRLPAAVP